MDAKERMLRIAAELTKAGSRELKGEFGEQRAMKWFERHGYDYYRFPQTEKTMPKSLARRGGKRPDFAVDFGGDMVYFDAKFHLLPDPTEFALEEVELQKFLAFREWVRDEYGDEGQRDVVFIVYPQEFNGGRFVLIHLSELLNGQVTTVRNRPGRRVSLLNRDGLWFDQ